MGDRSYQSASTSLRPKSTCCWSFELMRPVFSNKNDLSIVNIWETLTTDSRSKPHDFFVNRTLPGAPDKKTFEVIAATSTVFIWLWLKELSCTTKTGLRQPGSEPNGSRNSAHHTSPRFNYQSSLRKDLLCMDVSAWSIEESALGSE